MTRSAGNQVILAEMARAIRAELPDADWHEVEPALRALWDHAPRHASWDAVRHEAAHYWRFDAAPPPRPAPVIDPSCLGSIHAAVVERVA
ncbi:hypothetical protein [Luteimonas deserti]|uniref:Uncharacterized protein n=1 Tax=Luteimonas deserti TaxID=2752306 RepID=A0A7Z0TX17_9GAMM|nr:hypothetical protein [Luteimonas deserti]NYZ63979.1 hypothetical protein [Luteimonas deserti]